MDREKNTFALIKIYYAGFGLIGGFVAAAFVIDALQQFDSPRPLASIISDKWLLQFLLLQWVGVVVISVMTSYGTGHLLAGQAVRSRRRVTWLFIHLATSAILMTSVAASVERWALATWIFGTVLAVSANWGMAAVSHWRGII